LNDVQKATDEFLVEVGKAKECLDVSTVLRDWPVMNSSNLYRVYLNLILRDNQPKKLYLLFVKFVFLRAEK